MDDRHAPATKGDIADTEQRLVERMNRGIAGSEQRLVETMRDIEAKLLQAFYGYAKSNDSRVLEVEANEAVLRTRVATLESRIMEVERRLNIPPIQQLFRCKTNMAPAAAYCTSRPGCPNALASPPKS